MKLFPFEFDYKNQMKNPELLRKKYSARHFQMNYIYPKAEDI